MADLPRLTLPKTTPAQPDVMAAYAALATLFPDTFAWIKLTLAALPVK